MAIGCRPNGFPMVHPMFGGGISTVTFRSETRPKPALDSTGLRRPRTSLGLPSRCGVAIPFFHLPQRGRVVRAALGLRIKASVGVQPTQFSAPHAKSRLRSMRNQKRSKNDHRRLVRLPLEAGFSSLVRRVHRPQRANRRPFPTLQVLNGVDHGETSSLCLSVQTSQETLPSFLKTKRSKKLLVTGEPIPSETIPKEASSY